MKALPPSFPLPPRILWFGPSRGLFMEPFAFLSPSLGRIEIEAGFDTDFASVPRGLWNLFPKDGEYSPAAWIHDWLYWYQELNGKPVERAQADAVFLEGMEALGVGWVTRSVMYRAVRMGGGGPWARERSKRLGLPERITPSRQKLRFSKLRR